jgi:hypothetical protein
MQTIIRYLLAFAMALLLSINDIDLTYFGF